MKTPLAALLLVSAFAFPCAHAQTPVMGAVVMHGKGGSPTKFVVEVAAALEQKGYLVANLDMPWSGSRNYDVDTDRAEKEIDEALAAMKAKGAKKVFVIGHSQGGAFALHYGGKHAVDGVVAIAPGGSVDSPVYKQFVGESLARARQLVAEGKGAERQRLEDYEGARKNYSVIAVPSAYVTWFDPAGAMNMNRAVRVLPPTVPVLWVSPTGDYPGLRTNASRLYGLLPANPLNRFSQPEATHLGAPAASIPGIIEWTTVVANSAR